jgi:NAD(P)-dependent dehydrogenase (short-subunit alcohol dehydrogenase family)
MNPSYQVSKAGLSQLTRSISVDYSKDGIRANNVVPGYIKSNMTIDSYNSEIKRVERINRSSMKRWGEPSDLIGAVHFLSSDESSFVTGADIFVDGGWNINGL